MWLHSSVGRASHRYRGGHGFESRWSPDFFFRLLLSNCSNWKIYCNDHSHLQPQFKNELFHILHINQNECVHLWATMAQTWSHNTETNQMVSNGAQFFLECIMGWFLLLTHNKWGDFMPHVMNWKFGGMLYIQGDSSRKEHDCNLFYSWKLFLRYKCEIFILGVLGFLKTTRSFPNIPEEVRSLPKKLEVFRRRPKSAEG